MHTADTLANNVHIATVDSFGGNQGFVHLEDQCRPAVSECAMDAQRALLDELMGVSRDGDKAE